MTTDLSPGTTETNVFSLIWNRRLLVVAFALAFAGVGLLVSELRHKEYTAEASVLLSNLRRPLRIPLVTKHATSPTRSR